MEIQVLGTKSFPDALERLVETDRGLDNVQYAALLKECGTANNLEQGKQVHAHISQHGGYHLDRDTFVGNHLVHMYGKCGCIEEARKVFDKIRVRNVYSCNIMLAALAENGHLHDAKSLFDSALQRNCVTWNAMIDAYIQNKELRLAKDLFDIMPERNVVTWSSMIEAYAHNGELHIALRLFKLMDLEGVKPNRVTYVITLEACADFQSELDGIMIHKCVKQSGLESDVKVSNTLIHMYGCCGRLQEAHSMFEKMLQKSTVSWNAIVAAYAQNGHMLEAKKMFNLMPLRDTASWNAMMAAYTQNGQNQKALELFRCMDYECNAITYVIIVDACANLAAVEEGMEAHSRARASGFDGDVRVANALLNMYSKCCRLTDAKDVFDGMRLKNTVSWTAMITAHTQTGRGREALQLFKTMDLEGVKPDNFTYVTVLDACTLASSLEEGRSAYARAVFEGYSSDALLTNALMNLFGKCGCLSSAVAVFDSIQHKDIVSLNGMISMYANNGDGEKAVEFLKVMGLEGVEPDSITFMSILSACSHSGLLDLAWNYFPCILGDHGIAPGMDHYVSMLDLLARAGRLEEAVDLITHMPYEPPALAWTILLGAYNVQGRVEKCGSGKDAAEQAIQLEPALSAPYILFSNINK